MHKGFDAAPKFPFNSPSTMTAHTDGTPSSSDPNPLPPKVNSISASVPALQDGFDEAKPPSSKPIAPAPLAPPKLGAELAEDLNEVIKNKYIKGMSIVPVFFRAPIDQLLIFSRPLPCLGIQTKRSERVPMPSST